MKLPDGQLCTGNGDVVARTDTSAPLAAQWERIYGSGFYVANVLGNPLAVRAMMTCNKGATVQGEAAAATPGVYTSGVAQDSNGNLYKLGF